MKFGRDFAENLKRHIQSAIPATHEPLWKRVLTWGVLSGLGLAVGGVVIFTLTIVVLSIGLPDVRDFDKLAGIKRARVIVFAVSDPVATRMALKAAKDVNPSVYAITRTRYTSEVDTLYKLGANQVISEEFETSIEIFARVLGEYHIPTNIIQNQIDIIRHEGYAMLRGMSLPKQRLMELSSIFATSITSTFLVTEDSPATNKTFSELDLRKKTGAIIIAVVRGGAASTVLSADFKFFPRR